MFSQLEQAITFENQINRMICDFSKSLHVLLEVSFEKFMQLFYTMYVLMLIVNELNQSVRVCFE